MIGIDKINFYTPNTYIDLATLATHRGINPDKFTIGIGQSKMAVPPISQDTVSMAANAAFPILEEDDLNSIDLVIVGTESGVDASKSVASFTHDLLNIQPFSKSIEIKQACYGATAGLMMAVDYVRQHQDRKVLVIASDISRYGLNSPGEVTQGAGAVAMLVSKNPRLLEIMDDNISITENIFDFWRPNYSDTAFVDGKFSNQAYISFFEKLWNEYKKRNQKDFANFDAFCMHLPYTKMGKKALLPLLEQYGDHSSVDKILKNYDASTYYSREIGNIYTGSLYLSFISLLDSESSIIEDHSNIGFFSYGSGAVAEFFTGRLVPGFKNHLSIQEHASLLNQRVSLTVDEYTELFNQELPKTGDDYNVPQHPTDNGTFYLKELKGHQRHYGTRSSKGE